MAEYLDAVLGASAFAAVLASCALSYVFGYRRGYRKAMTLTEFTTLYRPRWAALVFGNPSTHAEVKQAAKLRPWAHTLVHGWPLAGVWTRSCPPDVLIVIGDRTLKQIRAHGDDGIPPAYDSVLSTLNTDQMDKAASKIGWDLMGVDYAGE